MWLLVFYCNTYKLYKEGPKLLLLNMYYSENQPKHTISKSRFVNEIKGIGKDVICISSSVIPVGFVAK